MRLIDADKCISELKNKIHTYGNEYVREGAQRAISFINHTLHLQKIRITGVLIKELGARGLLKNLIPSFIIVGGDFKSTLS